MLCDLEQVSYRTSLTLVCTPSVRQGGKIGSAPSPWVGDGMEKHVRTVLGFPWGNRKGSYLEKVKQI